MSKNNVLIAYKLFFAALVFIAIIVQFIIGSIRTGFMPVNFFSFFTIEGNLFAVVVFILGAIGYIRGRQVQSITGLRGAALVYMTLIGVVYVLLLSGLEESLQTPIPWVNFVLHYMFPVVVIVDWFIDRPGERVSYRTAALWLIFPIVWLVYTLIRGPIAHWYPYPFLNPAHGGYGQVAIICIIITVFVCLLSLGALLTSGGRGRRVAIDRNMTMGKNE